MVMAQSKRTLLGNNDRLELQIGSSKNPEQQPASHFLYETGNADEDTTEKDINAAQKD